MKPKLEDYFNDDNLVKSDTFQEAFFFLPANLDICPYLEKFLGKFPKSLGQVENFDSVYKLLKTV
jgi:hypothetical protein